MKSAFDRVFVIMLENETQTAVLSHPYMKKLAERGTLLNQYRGVKHPSQPNYIASIGGSNFGIFDDKPHNIDATCLVDLLEAKKVSWKAYMEDMPEDKKTIPISADSLYFRKHNPFVSFKGVSGDPKRMAKVVNAKGLAADVAADRLPQFSWYTPNIQNDGHTPPAGYQPNVMTRNVNFLAEWLQGFIEPLLADPKFKKGTMVVVTFDESVPYADNRVYTVLLGDMVKPGTVVDTPFNHYGLLRTVQENFALGTLGRSDEHAAWFEFLWGAPAPAFDPAVHNQKFGDA